MKTMTVKTQLHRSHEKGVALLTVMFAILLLSAIAFGMMYMSTTETQVNSNFRDSQMAYFAARSGIEEARERIRKGSANTLTGIAGFPTTTPTAAGGVLYILNPNNTNVQPWTAGNAYFDTELAHQNFYATPANPGTGVPSAAVPATPYYVSTNALASSNTLDLKWVRINVKTNSSANDMAGGSAPGTAYSRLVDTTRFATAADMAAPVCFNQNVNNTGITDNGPAGFGQQVVLPNGETDCELHAVANNQVPWQRVYTMTALAVTPTGARRMLQAEVARIVSPGLPAALTLDGPGPGFGSLTSQNSKISGVDGCVPAPPAVPAAPLPSVGAYDATSVGDVSLFRNDAAHYPGNPPQVSDLGNDPGPPAGLNMLGSLSTVSGLQSLLSSLKSEATSYACTSCTPAGTPALGITGNPIITYVDGNYTLGTSGAGILVVTGNFAMSGNLTWDGLIIVVGTGQYTQAGTSSVNGGVLVANINTDAGGNPLTGNTPGPPNVNFQGGGGSGGIFFDSCAITSINNLTPFRILGMKELPY